MLDSSSLDKPITLQRRVTGKDAYGQPLDQWLPVFADPLYASIKPVTARERMRAGAINIEISHTVATRYAPEFDDPRAVAAMRVLYKNRVFNVLGAINVNEDDECVILECQEGTFVGQ